MSYRRDWFDGDYDSDARMLAAVGPATIWQPFARRTRCLRYRMIDLWVNLAWGGRVLRGKVPYSRW